jgi:DEAD/DEAH box helicase
LRFLRYQFSDDNIQFFYPFLYEMSSEDDLKSSFSQLDIGENLNLAAWGLPPSVVKVFCLLCELHIHFCDTFPRCFQAYRDQGVERMFPWQAECLATEGVWDQSRDLLLAAPTSGGKSLVAELLAAKTTLRRGKKTIIVLPFKALVMEKTNYLKVSITLLKLDPNNVMFLADCIFTNRHKSGLVHRQLIYVPLFRGRHRRVRD